jgi:hypothetical protein
MLKTRGSKVKSRQLAQFLDFVLDTCPWFPREGTVNLETWRKVGERLRTATRRKELRTSQFLPLVCGVKFRTV